MIQEISDRFWQAEAVGGRAISLGIRSQKNGCTRTGIKRRYAQVSAAEKHRTIKGEIGLLPHDVPSALEEAIRSFVDYYNYLRYHEGLGNVTPI